MTIYLGTDHAGFELKEAIKKHLISKGYRVEDCGALAYDEPDDYPDYIIPTAQNVAKKPDEHRGIVFGGSGQGEALAANKVKGIRAALYYGGNLEIVKLARVHNNANILSLGARFVDLAEAKKAAELFLTTEFKDEERHVRRLAKIKKFEKK